MATFKEMSLTLAYAWRNFDAEKSGFQLLIRLFVSKTVPSEAKANKSKPQMISWSSFSVRVNLLKKLAVVNKLHVFLPSALLHGEREHGFMARAAVLKSS